jgi:putative peptidoglycan lipid II flippase
LLWLTARLALAPLANIHGLAQAAVLLVLIAGGMAVYGGLLGFLGVMGWRETLNAIRHPPRSDLRA